MNWGEVSKIQFVSSQCHRSEPPRKSPGARFRERSHDAKLRAGRFSMGAPCFRFKLAPLSNAIPNRNQVTPQAEKGVTHWAEFFNPFRITGVWTQMARVFGIYI